MKNYDFENRNSSENIQNKERCFKISYPIESIQKKINSFYLTYLKNNLHAIYIFFIFIHLLQCLKMKQIIDNFTTEFLLKMFVNF